MDLAVERELVGSKIKIGRRSNKDSNKGYSQYHCMIEFKAWLPFVLPLIKSKKTMSFYRPNNSKNINHDK